MATAAQKAAAAEKREKMKTLASEIAAMTDEQRVELIARFGAVVNIEGRPLSPNNTCMIASQRETASVVGGFRQWKNAGRVVRRGERGVSIWIPGRRRNDDSDTSTENDDRDVYFTLGTVFDIAQTDELVAEEAAA